MSRIAPGIAHKNYEILRRLPKETVDVVSLCDMLKEDFAHKGLIESEKSKEKRNEWRDESWPMKRMVAAETLEVLKETAKELDITVQQVITLLVVIYNPLPSWTARQRRLRK